MPRPFGVVDLKLWSLEQPWQHRFLTTLVHDGSPPWDLLWNALAITYWGTSPCILWKKDDGSWPLAAAWLELVATCWCFLPFNSVAFSWIVPQLQEWWQVLISLQASYSHCLTLPLWISKFSFRCTKWLPEWAWLWHLFATRTTHTHLHTRRQPGVPGPVSLVGPTRLLLFLPARNPLLRCSCLGRGFS